MNGPKPPRADDMMIKAGLRKPPEWTADDILRGAPLPEPAQRELAVLNPPQQGWSWTGHEQILADLMRRVMQLGGVTHRTYVTPRKPDRHVLLVGADTLTLTQPEVTALHEETIRRGAMLRDYARYTGREL